MPLSLIENMSPLPGPLGSIRCSHCGQQGNHHRHFRNRMQELTVCRQCGQTVDRFDWHAAGATDKTDYARSCGYALEEMVIVHDGKVLSFQRRPWHDFINDVRAGMMIAGGLGDPMRWHEQARQYLTAVCRHEYASQREQHLKKRRSINSLRLNYSEYVHYLIACLNRNDHVAFVDRVGLEGYAHVSAPVSPSQGACHA